MFVQDNNQTKIGTRRKFTLIIKTFLDKHVRNTNSRLFPDS